MVGVSGVFGKPGGNRAAVLEHPEPALGRRPGSAHEAVDDDLEVPVAVDVGEGRRAVGDAAGDRHRPARERGTRAVEGVDVLADTGVLRIAATDVSGTPAVAGSDDDIEPAVAIEIAEAGDETITSSSWIGNPGSRAPVAPS